MSKNTRRYWLYKMLSFVMYVIPLAILFGINRNVYFQSGYTGLSAFGYVIVAMIVLAFKSRITSLWGRQPMLTLSIIVLIIALITRYIADQLLLISACSVLGCLLSMVFERPASVYYNHIMIDGKRVRLPTVPHRKAWADAYLGVDMTTTPDEIGI